MTQLVIPHLPADLSADERMIDSVSGIDTLASGDLPRPQATKMLIAITDLMEERQGDFEDAACLPVGEALTATLNVALVPTIDGAVEALLAVYTSVEMKAFMRDDSPANDRVMLKTAGEHLAYMKKVRDSAAVRGFEKILDKEVALVAHN